MGRQYTRKATMRSFDVPAAIMLAMLATGAAAQTPGIVSEPIPRDERAWCMGLAPYQPGFEKVDAGELLRRYPQCFAAPAGCARPSYGAARNVLEAETRAYVACMEARRVTVDD